MMKLLCYLAPLKHLINTSCQFPSSIHPMNYVSIHSQGANQALQDAYFLAQGICEINAKDLGQTSVTVASDAQRAGLALRQLARSVYPYYDIMHYCPS